MQLSRVIILNWKDIKHPDAGGAESYCHNVAVELVGRGVRVTYVTSRPRGATRHDTIDGYRVVRFGSRLGVYPLALLWLLLNRRRVDAVIDSQNGIPFFSPLVLSKRSAISLLIHHVHQDQFAMYFPPLAARLGRWLESAASRRVYGGRPVCTVSPSTRTDVRARLGLRGQVHVTPNGYRVGGGPSHRRSSRPTVACVGRLTTHKRWELVLDAVAAVVQEGGDLVVDLIGKGPEEARLREHATRLGLDDHVRFHGRVSDAERDRLLGQAWLTVCTSVAEGWGLTVIEAAAQGVPALSLDVPGLRDSVRDGETGWLVRDEADLAAGLRDALALLADEATAEAYAARCRRWAASLTWSATADRFLAVMAAERTRRTGWPVSPPARTDATVLVTLDRAGARLLDERALRELDQTTFCRACVDSVDGPFVVLLNAADENDAGRILATAGLPPGQAEVTVRLARARDLVQWHGAARPHNALPFLSPHTCPMAPHLAASAPRAVKIA